MPGTDVEAPALEHAAEAAKVRGEEAAAAKLADLADRVEAAPPVEPPKPRMARRDDYAEGLEAEEFTLPAAQTVVLVRPVDAVLFTNLVHLPDLLGYREIQSEMVRLRDELAKLGDEMGEEAAAEESERRAREMQGRFLAEQIAYFAAIVHVAVADPDAGPEEVECSCGMAHAASLWSLAQCRRMDPRDSESVAEFALRGLRLGRLGPFSEGTADSPTPPSAEPGT